MTRSQTAQTVAKILVEKPQETRSLWRAAVLHIIRDRLTVAALAILFVLTLLCLFGPPVLENTLGLNATRTSVTTRFLPPGTENHFLGTDHLGRDQLIRILYGGRVSLAIAYSASVIAVSIGVALGLASGYYGGWVDDFVSWLINTLNAIPPLFLLLIASALWQPTAEVLVIALALLGWIGTCRLVRGETLSLKEHDFVLAARALGSGNLRIMTLHILPNVLPLVIVTLTVIAGNLILIESGLSFLGVGVQPPTPTWGNMLTDSRSYFATGAHLVLWPGCFILLTVMCFYLVGDGLRDALDPHSVRR